jgi:hypothetical protein
VVDSLGSMPLTQALNLPAVPGGLLPDLYRLPPELVTEVGKGLIHSDPYQTALEILAFRRTSKTLKATIDSGPLGVLQGRFAFAKDLDATVLAQNADERLQATQANHLCFLSPRARWDLLQRINQFRDHNSRALALASMGEQLQFLNEGQRDEVMRMVSITHSTKRPSIVRPLSRGTKYLNDGQQDTLINCGAAGRSDSGGPTERASYALEGFIENLEDFDSKKRGRIPFLVSVLEHHEDRIRLFGLLFAKKDLLTDSLSNDREKAVREWEMANMKRNMEESFSGIVDATEIPTEIKGKIIAVIHNADALSDSKKERFVDSTLGLRGRGDADAQIHGIVEIGQRLEKFPRLLRTKLFEAARTLPDEAKGRAFEVLGAQLMHLRPEERKAFCTDTIGMTNSMAQSAAIAGASKSWDHVSSKNRQTFVNIVAGMKDEAARCEGIAALGRIMEELESQERTKLYQKMLELKNPLYKIGAILGLSEKSEHLESREEERLRSEAIELISDTSVPLEMRAEFACQLMTGNRRRWMARISALTAT